MDHAGVCRDVVGAVRWMTFVVEGGRTPPYSTHIHHKPPARPRNWPQLGIMDTDLIRSIL